ncbi:MAG TPA: hypothetical protein VNH18_34950 [Bryobacteraceae bacterium]|nr:hypothetical protein [Bryobacteraceae bacterium]
MTKYETLSLVLNGIAAVLLFATVTVYYFQLRAMQGQLKAGQDSARSQNLVALVNYLQGSEVREARAVVVTVLRTKPFKDWDEKDKKAASLVCSTYDVAAIMIQLGGIPAEPIKKNWGPSIRLCYETVSPWIAEMQKPEMAGPTYWDDFGWLYSEVKRSAKNVGAADDGEPSIT